MYDPWFEAAEFRFLERLVGVFVLGRYLPEPGERQMEPAQGCRFQAYRIAQITFGFAE
jgi:hypothetical protein